MMTEGTSKIVVGLGPVPLEQVQPYLDSDTQFIVSPTPVELAQAQGAIVRAAYKIGPEELDQMPRLKVLARTGVGVDQLDVEKIKERRIAIAITPGSNTKAVAEGALAHLLLLVKSLPQLHTLVQQGKWEHRSQVSVRDLDGSCLGIVGFGRIGRELASMASALGVQVLAYDPYSPVDEEYSVSSLEELLSLSDYLSLHLPLTAETENLIDENSLKLMKDGAIIINVSRGALMDHDAVLVALNQGKVAGVALDSFIQEPPVYHPLFDHPRASLSPHMMGLSRAASEATYRMAAQAVAAVLRGEKAPYTI